MSKMIALLWLRGYSDECGLSIVMGSRSFEVICVLTPVVYLQRVITRIPFFTVSMLQMEGLGFDGPRT